MTQRMAQREKRPIQREWHRPWLSLYEVQILSLIWELARDADAHTEWQGHVCPATLRRLAGEGAGNLATDTEIMAAVVRLNLLGALRLCGAEVSLTRNNYGTIAGFEFPVPRGAKGR